TQTHSTAAPIYLATDQRGFSRSVSAPDMGAFQTGNRFVVSTSADAGPLSLRKAVELADTGAPGLGSNALNITFAAGLSGQTILLTGGLLDMTTPGVLPVTIDGAGQITIKSDGTSGLFEFDGGGISLSLSGVTLTGANGSAVVNGGVLTLVNDTFVNCSAFD